MKKTYSKSGLGVIAMYGAMSIVSSIVLILCIGVCVFIFAFMNRGTLPALLENLNPGDLDMEIVTSILQLAGITKFLVIGLVSGSALGVLTGMLIMRKIMGKDTLVKIEKKRLKFNEFAVYLLVAFGVWGVGAAFGNIGEFFGISMDNAILENAGDDIIYYYIYAVLGAPILEELAFRKIFLDRTHLFGETCAALISALFFGLFHGNSAQFFLAFGIGLVSAVCYLRTGKIIYSILIHFFINLTATLVELFDFVGIDIWLAWNVAVLCIIIAGILAIFAYRDRPQFRLSLPGTQNAGEQVFKNVGMRIAIIGGTVLVSVTDAYMILMNLVSGKGPMSLISLAPMIVNIILVIVLTKTVGTHVRKPLYPEYLNPQPLEPQAAPLEQAVAVEPQVMPVEPQAEAEEIPVVEREK